MVLCVWRDSTRAGILETSMGRQPLLVMPIVTCTKALSHKSMGPGAMIPSSKHRDSLNNTLIAYMPA